jgi:uncharacterized membrane protein YtjA (UPF0391 family)
MALITASADMPKLAAGMGSPGHARAQEITRGGPVLHYAVVFLVIALIAAVLGFGGIAADAAGLAKLLFYVFAGLSAVAFVLGLVRRP